MKCGKRERFEEFKATGRLPSPKGIAFAIIDRTQRDDVNINEITHLIQTDPAISGRLLKFANSAHRGGRPIVSISKAVILLGIFRVRQLALGFSLLNDHLSGQCRGFDYQAFWSRSLATAIANQEIAHHAQSAPEEGFTCGLLSGVGRLALATLFPEDYAEVMEIAREMPPEVLSKLECDRFDMDHRDLTAALLSDWGLPSIFVDAVFHHENAAAAEFPVGSRAHTLTQALHFSATLAQACVADDQARWHLLPEVYHLGAQLGLERDSVAEIFDQVVKEWQEWGRVLQIPTQNLPPMAEMAAVGPSLPTQQPEEATLSVYPMRILIVSADAALLTSIESTLAAGHTVTKAASIGQALETIDQAYPQLVICDWDPDALNALQLAQILRQTKKGRQIYCLVLLSPPQEDLLPEAIETGIDDYLFKPFGPKVLQARLRAAQRVLHLQEEIQIERESALRSSDEWAHTNRRLLQEALTDPLTGLPNRRYGLDRLTQEWSFAAHSGLPMACLMIDIDHFKAINDHYGHDKGDEALRHLAEVLIQTVRKEDVVFRFGGEEFAALCPATGPEAAIQLGERIRQAVAAAPFGPAWEPFNITVSIGVAAFSPAQANADALLKQADEALYHAKERGRNRVIAASP